MKIFRILNEKKSQIAEQKEIKIQKQKLSKAKASKKISE